MQRRSLLLGFGLGAVVPSLVRAESLLDLPGDPLSKAGLRAAEQWATQEFNERPGVRLKFASGHAYRWQQYQCFSRGRSATDRDYAVALEVAVTDAKGNRVVHTVPIDGAGIEGRERRRQEASREQARLRWERMLLDDPRRLDVIF